MLLTRENSLCEKNQKIVVSRDRGNTREHRALNPNGSFDLRHYKLDGVLVRYEKCCDYLLVNDSSKKAYFIELKGCNVNEAVPQLEAAERKFRDELQEYTTFFRIIASKSRTHEMQKNAFRKFLEKHGSRVLCRTGSFAENLT